MGASEVVRVLIGTTDAGVDSFEPLLATSLGGGRWRLERSPLMALGLARNDVFRLDSDGRSYELLEGGGHYAIQLYYRRPLAAGDLQAIESTVVPRGGIVDAHAKQVVVVSFPEQFSLESAKECLREVGGDFQFYVSRPPQAGKSGA